MLHVADRSVTSERTAHRDLFAETMVWRLAMLGAAALGFLVTFLLLDHEIPAFRDVVLPLLAILPAYLVLTSLNMWWAAKTASKLGLIERCLSPHDAQRLRRGRILKACCGLAFGVAAALWYVHSVS